MGQLSSACRIETYLQQCQSRDLARSVALGTATASAKERSVDQSEVFPGRWLESLGLRHRNRQDARHRRAQTSDAVRHRQHADTAAPENQGRRQPVRPPMGKLFRGASWPRDDGLTQGTDAACPAVAEPGADVSRLPPDDHEVQRVASIPSGTGDRWWHGRESQSADAASGLPRDRAWPTILRG